MRRRVFLLMAVMVTVMNLPRAQGYEEIAVVDGGSLRGTVTLEGDIPKPKAYNLVTFPDPVYCGRISNGHGWRLLQPFHVGPDGAFRDVVVMLEDMTQGKPIEADTSRVEAVDCTFRPFISVVWNKRPLEVVNMDPVFHDIQAYETSRLGARVLFNAPLPMNPRYTKEGVSAQGRTEHLAGTPLLQRIDMHKGRRMFVMQCGFHAYMESWGVAVDHPYVAMTDQDGHFEIGNIPPGTYRMVVWHPVIRRGEGEVYDVTITPRATTTIDVNIEAPTGQLYANQLEKNPRFGMGLMGEGEIIPSVEKQEY